MDEYGLNIDKHAPKLGEISLDFSNLGNSNASSGLSNLGDLNFNLTSGIPKFGEVNLAKTKAPYNSDFSKTNNDMWGGLDSKAKWGVGFGLANIGLGLASYLQNKELLDEQLKSARQDRKIAKAEYDRLNANRAGLAAWAAGRKEQPRQPREV